MAELGDGCDGSSSSEEENLDPRIQVKYVICIAFLNLSGSQCQFSSLVFIPFASLVKKK